MKYLTQRGDTIVEVMISLAVLGAALTGAYRIATRSLAQMQAAQERTEALNLAQEQIERLKQSLALYGSAPSTNPRAVFPVGTAPAICIRRDLTVVKNLTSASACVSDTNQNYFVGIIYRGTNTASGLDNQFIAFAGRASLLGTSGGAPSQIATVNYKVY